jgi:hypothetical protein
MEKIMPEGAKPILHSREQHREAVIVEAGVAIGRREGKEQEKKTL